MRRALATVVLWQAILIATLVILALTASGQATAWWRNWAELSATTHSPFQGGE